MNGFLGTLPLVVGLLAPVAGRADVSVEDGWDKSGRVVVDVRGRRAVVAREPGAVVIYSGKGSAGKEVARIVPFGPGRAAPRAVASCRVAEKSPAGAKLEVSFSGGGTPLEASFTFSGTGDIEVAPGGGMQGISIRAAIAFGVLPGVVPDDVVYDPAKYPRAQVQVPAESLFVCLLRGENDILACAWPRGDQKLRLIPARDGGTPRFAELVLEQDGRSAYVGVMSAPSIWHRQKLSSAYLEKDVVTGWRRPFDAKWKTQLSESGVPTSFFFADHAEEIWRPDTGSYPYPVRFDGAKAVFHLGKKIPPAGTAFIYALEGHADTPLALMNRCSAETAAIASELTERKDYPPPVRRKINVGYWHCWGTAMVKRTIYRYGMQNRESAFLEEHADNYVDLAVTNQRRHREYIDFADGMRKKLDSWTQDEKDHAGVQAYLKRMGGLLDKMRKRFLEPMEDESPEDYIREADELGKRLKVLVREDGTELYPEYCDIVERLNGISAGMHEDVSKWFGTCGREWFQQAAYACADNPEAVKYAAEIRRAIRGMLKTRSYEVVEEP